jgi:hypothetical protein
MSSNGESGIGQVRAAMFFLIALTQLCKASSVTCNFTYFSGLLFNNFLLVCAWGNFTNILREGRVDFSVLFYTVANFRKP